MLAPTRVRRPGFVGDYVDGDEGVVVTEFVDGRQGDVLAGCEPAVARSVVGSIAELHARWWGRAPIEVPALDERLRRNLSAEHVEGCIELHHDVLTERARRLMRGLPDRVDDLADELGRMPMTVVHGDLHLDNVIIGHDGTATILDWGRPRRAAAAVDVARCFLEVTDAHPDDDRGRAFLATYLDTLRMREVDVDPTGFRTMIDVAQLAFAPGIIRWAASSRPAPGTRPWSLLRNALTRWTAYWSPA